MIYLDHNATSPLLDEVRAAMEPWWGVPANSASVHRAGQAAAAAVERAREQVAALVGGNPAGVVFTSGATEANHTFLRGMVRYTDERTLFVGALEHPSVHAAARVLLASGFERVDRPEEAAVISLQAANHETGGITPMPDVDTIRHVDATQAAGRIPLDLGAMDGVSLSAHKLGGPPGIGALVLRDGEAFPPLFTGGAQERGRRAGTVPTALAVGMGAAAELAVAELADRRQRWLPLQALLDDAMRAAGGLLVHAETPRLPQTSTAVFPGVLGETLVMALDLRGFCVSSGAACASGSVEPSPVLLALGIESADCGLRVSLGPRTTRQEVTAFCAVLGGVVGSLSPS